MAELLILGEILLGTAESAIVKRYQIKHGKGGAVFTGILAVILLKL